MCYFKMRRHCFHASYGYKTWTKPVRVAAVGNAENTTSDVHDIADVRYYSLINAFLKFPTFQRA